MIALKKLTLIAIAFTFVPFAYAMENKELTEQLRALIDRPGCDVNEVKRLLDAGADPGLGLKNGWTTRQKPLIWTAAWHGHEQVCKLLIERGVAVNVWYEQVGCVLIEQTPLMVAAENGHEGACHTLLQAGAEIIMDNSFARNYTHLKPRIQLLLCNKQDQLNNSIIVMLGCLRRLKYKGDELGCVLYPNVAKLLKPYLKSSYYLWLSEMKEICQKKEGLARWEELKEIGVISGAAAVFVALCALTRSSK